MIDFHFAHLAKNRRGPFRILVKNIEGLYYNKNYDQWEIDPHQAWDYGSRYCFYIAAKFGGKVILSTAAGDIDLKEENYLS